MNVSISLENQLLVTKFYVPVVSGPLISRPRLSTLLAESLKFPLTPLLLPVSARLWHCLSGPNRCHPAIP